MQSEHVLTLPAGCCMKLTRKIEPFLAIIISSKMYTVRILNKVQLYTDPKTTNNLDNVKCEILLKIFFLFLLQFLHTVHEVLVVIYKHYKCQKHTTKMQTIQTLWPVNEWLLKL